MLSNYLIILLSVFASSLLMTFATGHFCRTRHILTAREIPVSGGIGIVVPWFTGTLVGMGMCNLEVTRSIAGIMLSASILFISSILDDWKEQPVIVKCMVQIVVFSIAVMFGVRTEIASVGNSMNIVITIVWMFAVTNAFNLLDVADGIAATTGWFIGMVFTVYAYTIGEHQLALVVIVLSAAVAGFLPFNIPPASIYMGNSGSHVLGFVLASIALLLPYAKVGHSVALLSPVCIMGLPLYDTGFVACARMLRRKNPFLKSRDHISLRLRMLGFSAHKVFLIMMSLLLLFCATGIGIAILPNMYGAACIVLAVVCVCVFTVKISKVSIDA